MFVAQRENNDRTRLSVGTASEMEREFRDFVESRLFDQPEAVEAACRLFRRVVNPFRNRSGKKRKPIRVVVNAGESRTGKTYFAELLAEFFHENPEALLFINGSDYMEHHQLINLVGAPRSYVGYVDQRDPKYVAPQPDEKDPYAELSAHNLVWCRRGSKYPVTIILVDEWEKACKAFNRVFLRIFDQARATLGNGQEVDFSDCIIILTTNLGMGEVEEEKSKNPLGFNQSKKQVTQGDVEQIVLKHMKQFAPPEFRNRVRENGEIVVFRPLTEEGKYKILDRDIVELQALFTSNPDVAFSLHVDEAARRFLMAEALKDDGNVSNLKSVVQTLLEEPITGEAVKRTVRLGDRVEVTHEGGSDALSFYLDRGGVLLLGGKPAGEECGADSGGQVVPDGSASGAQGGTVGSSGSAVAQAPTGAGSLTLPRKRQLAVVPGIPVAGGGVLIDMSELMFLMKAADLKTQAQQAPTLMAHYVIRMTNADNLDALTVSCLEMVRELHDILGVKVLQSETSYERPYTVTMRVLALPGQIELIGFRYQGVEVRLDEGGPDKSK